MHLPRYFVHESLCEDSIVTLHPRRSHHLLRVLRRRIDDAVELVDRDGQAWSAMISRDDPKGCELRVLARRERQTESTLTLHLGIALMRRTRLDQAIRKATELGVTTITLFVSERTELSELAPARLQHLRAVAQSAAEQSGRLRRPKVSGPTALCDHLRATALQRKLLFHPGGAVLSGDAIPRSAAALSGPEGGFSASEVATASSAGWEIVGLGPRTLRAETAPMAIATLLQAVWGDLRPGTDQASATISCSSIPSLGTIASSVPRRTR